MFVAALLTAGMTGAMLLPLVSLVTDEGAAGRLFTQPRSGGPTREEADAARWLEANSRPGELVATNVHCQREWPGGCDSRHFWIAALSERRLLVEGWAYTNRANRVAVATGQNPDLLPFWDPDRLAANDVVFTHPTAATVQRLREVYGVRWLYADTRAGEVSPALAQYAHLRHATADATVYEFK